MKNKYLSLLFASFLIVSGCETIGGHPHHLTHHLMNTVTLNKPTCKAIFRMKLETEYTLKQINITFHLHQHSL